jgi:hypothetical protein
MAYDEVLALRIRKAVARRKGFTAKKMFGGIGFTLNGNLCVGVWKDSLVVRLDLEDYDEALAKPGVNEFDITGRPMTGWVLVGNKALDDGKLKEWIGIAIGCVSALPKKQSPVRFGSDL